MVVDLEFSLRLSVHGRELMDLGLSFGAWALVYISLHLSSLRSHDRGCSLRFDLSLRSLAHPK